ncbi:hypothetical protein D3C76_1603600 [compost metagenome]
MLHLVDGFLVLVLAELIQAPILIHPCVQEVLVDCDQLVSEDLVEMLDDANVAFHDGVLPCKYVPIPMSLSSTTLTVKPKLLNNK